MGDTRFFPHYERVRAATDPAAEMRRLSDEAVVAALAAASRVQDPFLANVLATEAHNRMRRTQAALEHLGEGVLTVDLDERVTYANPAARRMLGTEGLVGGPLHALLRAGGRESRCTVAEAMRTRRVLRCESEPFAPLHGDAFPAAYTVAPLLREGAVEGAVLVFRDVTERVRAEAAARESEARWRCLAEAAFEGILVHDGERVLDVNEAFARMMRASPAALRVEVRALVAQASREVVERLLRPSEEPVELRVRRPDGTEFAAEARARACTYAGRAAHVVALRPRE